MADGARGTDALDAPDATPRAFRGGVMRASGRAVGMLVALISAPVLIHHLGVEGFGKYTTVTALVGLVGTGAEAGLLAIALREFATQEEDARVQVMRHLLGMRITATVFGILLAAGFAVLAGYEDVLVIGVLTSGAGLVFVMSQALLAVPMQADMRFVRVTALELGRQILTAALIVALAVGGASLGAFFLVPIAAGGIALILTIVLVRSTVSVRPTITPRAWAPLLHSTLPYALASLIYAAYFRVAMIVTSLGASETQTGYFATSYRVIEVLIALPAIAVTAVFPLLARAERDDHRRFVRASTRLIELGLFSGFFAAVGLVLAAPLIIGILTPGDAGEPAVAVLRLQAPALIATFAVFAATFPLLSMRRSRAILIANGAAFATVIALAVVLVDAHAAQGAAVATSIADLLLATVVFVLLRREIPEVLECLRGVPHLVVAAGLALAVLLLPVPVPAQTALGLTVFLGTAALLGRFPSELRLLRPRRP